MAPPTDIDPTVAKVDAPLDEIGVIGVPTRGYAAGEVYDPSVEERELQGHRGRRTYRRMRNDPTCGAIVTAVVAILRGIRWRVDPIDETAVALEAKRFAETVLDDMSHTWADVVADAVEGMTVYGWAAHELVWKLRRGPDQRDARFRSRFDDGLVGLRKAASRDQTTLERWIYDDAGGVQALVQKAPGVSTSIEIPIDRLLLYRTERAGGNPEGRSLLRSAFKPWSRRNHVETIEGVGVERELAGLPVVRAPARVLKGGNAADDQAKAAAVKMARDLRFNEAAALVLSSEPYRSPDGAVSALREWDIQLLSAAGNRTIDTTAIVQRYDGQIARSVLADFILLGQNKQGSFALSKSKTELFLAALTWMLDVIRDTWQLHMMPKLWTYNNLDVAVLPRLNHEDVAPGDLGELADMLRAMGTAGMYVTDPATQNNVRQKVGLPLLSEEDIEAAREAVTEPATPVEEPSGIMEQTRLSPSGE